MKIANVIGQEIYDSRGWPTLQVTVVLEDGMYFNGCAPAGISSSTYEAKEIRDGGARLWGRGVQTSVDVVEKTVRPLLVGQEVIMPDLDYVLIELDGTPDKSCLGSNILIATSIALYKACAYSDGIELYELFAFLLDSPSVSLPCPQFNIINGGKHANNALSIQEFMIAPLAAGSFHEAMELGVAIFHELKNILRSHNKFFGIGDEGGFTAQFASDQEALDMIAKALDKVMNDTGVATCAIALDVAASQFYDATQNIYIFEDQFLKREQLFAYYQQLIQNYPIYSIEDGFAQDDLKGWKLLTPLIEERIQIVADDIFATNPDRLEMIVHNNIATGAIIKPNQIGTVTETLDVIRLCKKYYINPIISHRSGETEDTFIADLAVGVSAGQIKAGGCCRSERVAKYNRLLSIESQLLNQQS